VFFFVAGAVAPIIQWTLQKKYKMTFLRYLNFPVIFGGIGFIPPATPLIYVAQLPICFLFNRVIRRRNPGWWLKYNCTYLSKLLTELIVSDFSSLSPDLLSGGLDAGYAIGIVVIFFALQYPNNGAIGLNTIQAWWGNTVYKRTADYAGLPYLNVPEGGKFGPSSW
jgi:OPT oligopeptide transporter protein